VVLGNLPQICGNEKGVPHVAQTYAAPAALLLALLTVVAATLVLAVSGVTAAGTRKATSHAAQHRPIRPAELALHDAMRKLWEDHITWTRNVIISVDAGLPDLNTVVARLLQNQTDIGNAIKPY
jgi:hypothetical protein